MSLFWLIVILILTFIEIITINLVTIWYVASAIVALIASFFIKDFTLQVAIFVLLGTIFLITTRKTLNKFLKEKKQNTNIDRIIGMIGFVVETIQKDKIGAVKVDGKVWSAYADKNIEEGKNVKVLEINSTKLKVEEE